MILYFDPPVVFNQYVSPVCLPYQAQEFPTGIDTYAIGWGNTQGKHNIIITRCTDKTAHLVIVVYYKLVDNLNY